MVEMVDAGLLDLSPLQHNVFPLERVNEAISTAAQRNGGFSDFSISTRPQTVS
jgi:hypothetical protein